MKMNNLSTEEIKFITKCLKENKPLPDSYRYIIPFETKKEYELTYDGKEREEDILADTMAVPLQPVKTFGNGKPAFTQPLNKFLEIKGLGDVKIIRIAAAFDIARRMAN
jgi:adenine-specific DNA-methyltransferase